MQFFRQIKSLLAKIACAAILLNAIAPAVSHALTNDQDDPATWMQVCTVAGVKLVPLDLSKPPNVPEQNSAMSMEHCGYCFNHAGDWGIPTAQQTSISGLNLSYAFPTLFYLSPRPLFAWASTQPRAPPVLA